MINCELTANSLAIMTYLYVITDSVLVALSKLVVYICAYKRTKYYILSPKLIYCILSHFSHMEWIQIGAKYYTMFCFLKEVEPY